MYSDGWFPFGDAANHKEYQSGRESASDEANDAIKRMMKNE